MNKLSLDQISQIVGGQYRYNIIQSVEEEMVTKKGYSAGTVYCIVGYDRVKKIYFKKCFKNKMDAVVYEAKLMTEKIKGT